MWTPILAFLSGAPALVYQVVWSREIALLAGGQIEAISVVLVAFFSGLALGAQYFGRRADTAASPLRLYGVLELLAGALAIASVPTLRALRAGPLASNAESVLLAAGALVLLPTTFLLGGTLPALLRARVRSVRETAGRAGWIVGWNTAGAIIGVGIAMLAIPGFGLRATIAAAGTTSIAVGVAAIALSRRVLRSPIDAPAPPAEAPETQGPARLALAAAGGAGVATLAFEVLAARMAALQLGSSLYAWGAVLALVLGGLAAGNLLLAGRAMRSEQPLLELGWLEIGAALFLATGLALLAPAVATPARGLGARTFAIVALGVFPPALLMGGAFPYFVRIAVGSERVGREFGVLSAVNTGGGILGALLAPFVLLPGLGAVGGALVCAGINGGIGLVLLWHASTVGSRLAVPIAAGLLVAVGGWSGAARPPATEGHVLHVEHGRQATAVVLQTGGRRDLVVDGDPEASTVGDALRTERLLAVLPLVLHPDPRHFLEVGLGSGTTLGTAARFPLETLDCVEISRAVIGAARFFAPHNGVVSAGGDDRLRVVHGDGRVFLARSRDRYDVIAANTLHPWSVGSTGLYSREYFARLAGALRPGGLAVQWVPVHRLGGDTLGSILATFFAELPHGGVWWGAENLVIVGSDRPLPGFEAERIERRLEAAGLVLADVGVEDLAELEARRIAGAATVREVLEGTAVLTDDRPILEARGASRRTSSRAPDLFALLVSLAEADPGTAGSLRLFLQARQLRSSSQASLADGREALAEAAGFSPARHSRAERLAARAYAAFDAGDFERTRGAVEDALAAVPDQRDALFALSALALRGGDAEGAEDALLRLLEAHPGDAEAWGQLAALRARAGDAAGARRAVGRALEADPYSPNALANAGLLAADDGNEAEARALLRRLRDVSPMGASAQERALVDALEE